MEEDACTRALRWLSYVPALPPPLKVVVVAGALSWCALDSTLPRFARFARGFQPHTSSVRYRAPQPAPGAAAQSASPGSTPGARAPSAPAQPAAPTP